MNRQIKFRVWDEKDKVMCYPTVFTFDSLNKIIFFKKRNEELELMIDFKFVQQFTGLLDKNGKEIYEGDIVKYSVNNRNLIVVYNDSMSAYMCGDTELHFFVENKVEIIGNTFENPEFLK